MESLDMRMEGWFWDQDLGGTETGVRTRDGYEWSPETHYLRRGTGAFSRR